MKRWPWDLLFALLVGIVGGLLYAWVIAPPQVTLTPNLLRPADKEAYYEVIAAAYAANGDLERARARLSLLSEQVPASLAAQAQRMLAAGRPFEEIQPLVRLAADLGKPPPPTQPLATPLALVTPFPPPSPTSPTTPPPEEMTPELPPTEATFAIPTLPPVTPQSAFTPVPTVGGFFMLTDYRTLCQPEQAPGLLQVWVNDARGQPLAGVPLLLVWEGGQEVFYTGLKPELGNGYADALLQAERLYSLQVGWGEPISNLSAPSCPPESGLRYGSIVLTFTRK